MPTNSRTFMETVNLVSTVLFDKKARDIAAINVSTVSPLCDAFVVATATSVRHAQGLATAVLDTVGRDKTSFLGMEGFQEGNWILIDLNDVLVHIMLEEPRKHFNLEGLWAEGQDIPLSFESTRSVVVP